MNNKARERLRDPKFQALPREAQLKIIGTDDPEFGTLPGKAQDMILEKASKNTLFQGPGKIEQPNGPVIQKPQQQQVGETVGAEDENFIQKGLRSLFGGKPLESKPVMQDLEPVESGPQFPQSMGPEDSEWQEFVNNSPAAILKARPGEATPSEFNLDPADGSLNGILRNLVPGVALAEDTLSGAAGAGKRLLEGKPGAALGQLSSALVPGLAGRLGKRIKKGSTSSFINAVGPRTGAEVASLEKVVPEILDNEDGLISMSQRSLEEKLSGAGKNISDRRAQLASAKAQLPNRPSNVDPTLKTVDDSVQRVGESGGVYQDTLQPIVADPLMEASALEALDLVDLLRKNSKGKTPSMRDVQTLKENVQTRARKGKLYETRQGNPTAKTEAYGAQAGALDDLIGAEFPEVNAANKGVHNLLEAGEIMEANRLGPISHAAPPSAVSGVSNLPRAVAAMGLGDIVPKAFREAMTPVRTAKAVGGNLLGDMLLEMGKVSPQEAAIINAMVSGQSSGQ